MKEKMIARGKVNKVIEEDKECELYKREWWRGKVKKVVEAGKNCKLCKRELIGNDCNCAFPGGTFTGKRWDEKTQEDILVWRGIPIKDIKYISGAGCWTENGKRFDYFLIKMNDNEKEYKIVYEDCFERNDARTEVYTMFNEYHNVPETYRLENEIHAWINGNFTHVGTRVENNVHNYEYKMLYEIEELRKQGKITDNGCRHLAGITAFEIVDNVPKKPLKPEHIQQLKNMGYKIPGITLTEEDEMKIEWRDTKDGLYYCEFCGATERVKAMHVRGIKIDANLCEDCVDVELTKSIKGMLEE
jgi:hypothetical protein